jgi:hypothetical protein
VSACFSILVGAIALPLLAQAPAIVVHGPNSELRLPSAMAVALVAVDSTFQPYREVDYLPLIREGYRPKPDETLYAVIGDFYGEGVPDLVVDGQGRDSSYLVALVSRRGGYQAHVLHRAERRDPQAIRYDEEHGLWVYLSRQAPGRIESSFEVRPLDLRTDAVQVNYFEKSSVVYYWDEGDFKEYWTGD